MRFAIAVCALFVIQSATAEDKLTFTKDIAPIFYENCVGCHRPGEIAPFGLLSYDTIAYGQSQFARLCTSVIPVFTSSKLFWYTLRCFSNHMVTGLGFRVQTNQRNRVSVLDHLKELTHT